MSFGDVDHNVLGLISKAVREVQSPGIRREGGPMVRKLPYSVGIICALGGNQNQPCSDKGGVGTIVALEWLGRQVPRQLWDSVSGLGSANVCQMTSD